MKDQPLNVVYQHYFNFVSMFQSIFYHYFLAIVSIDGYILDLHVFDIEHSHIDL